MKMSPADKKDAVLKWLAFNPFARGNVTFPEIQKGLIREYPVLANQVDWGSDLSKILDSLVRSGYVDTWKADMTYYTEIGVPPVVKNESRYTTTTEGQIAAYDLLPESKSKMTDVDLANLEVLLPSLSEYGRITFTSDVMDTLKSPSGGVFNKNNIEQFLYNNGFLKIIFPISGSPNHEKVLTDRGRNLKQLGSYKKFKEVESAEKIYQANKEKLQMEINSKQSQLITNQITTNENTIKTNTILKGVFIATAVISLCGVIVSYATYKVAVATSIKENQITDLQRQLKLLQLQADQQRKMLIIKCDSISLQASLIDSLGKKSSSSQRKP